MLFLKDYTIKLSIMQERIYRYTTCVYYYKLNRTHGCAVWYLLNKSERGIVDHMAGIH